MKPMFLCSLLCLLTMAFGAESAASQSRIVAMSFCEPRS